jgi:hypothetical protein
MDGAEEGYAAIAAFVRTRPSAAFMRRVVV